MSVPCEENILWIDGYQGQYPGCDIVLWFCKKDVTIAGNWAYVICLYYFIKMHVILQLIQNIKLSNEKKKVKWDVELYYLSPSHMLLTLHYNDLPCFVDCGFMALVFFFSQQNVLFFSDTMMIVSRIVSRYSLQLNQQNTAIKLYNLVCMFSGYFMGKKEVAQRANGGGCMDRQWCGGSCLPVYISHLSSESFHANVTFK